MKPLPYILACMMGSCVSFSLAYENGQHAVKAQWQFQTGKRVVPAK